MKQIKLMTVPLALVVLVAGLAGCGKRVGNREDMHLSVAVVGEPAGLDPALAATQGDEMASVHLYENLMRLEEGENGTEVVGALARSWECIDNLDGTETYVFHLRKDAKWSDGRGVQAADFVYAWQHLADERTGASRAALLDVVAGYEEARQGDPDALQVRAKDRYTLEVVLRCRCPYFLRSVCTAAATMPRRSDLPDKSDPVTNGPYAIEGYADGVLTMRVSDKYDQQGRLGPDTIAIHFCATAAQAARLLDEGTVNMAFGVEDEEIAGQGGWLRESCPETTVLIVNQLTPELNNQKLRQALSLAIDRVKLADLAGAALHTPATGLVPDGITASDGSVFRAPENTVIDNGDYAERCELARQLLEQSGVRALTEVTILCADEERTEALAQEICREWQVALGVTARVYSVPPEELAENLTAGTFHMALIACRADRNDADPFLHVWQSGHPENYAQFHSSAYDMLLRVAAASSTAEARDAYLCDAERLLVEQGGVMPLLFTNRAYRLDGDYTGLIDDGLGGFRLDALRSAAK